MRRGLIRARKAKHLTQEELADIIKVHRTSITKYETGAIDIPGRILRRLAEFFGRPMEELYVKSPMLPVGDEQEVLEHAAT